MKKTLKIQIHVRAAAMNHSQTTALRIRTAVKAGGAMNHCQRLA
jgi:hypothetical protein